MWFVESEANMHLTSPLFSFFAGIASFGISGVEYIVRRVAFHILQSYAGSSGIVRSQTLHEWRLEWQCRQCNTICNVECVPDESIGKHVAVGFTDALTKGHTNGRTVCCTQRLLVQKHVSVWIGYLTKKRREKWTFRIRCTDSMLLFVHKIDISTWHLLTWTNSLFHATTIRSVTCLRKWLYPPSRHPHTEESDNFSVFPADIWIHDGNRSDYLDAIRAHIHFRMHFSICNLLTTQQCSPPMTHRMQHCVPHWLHNERPQGTTQSTETVLRKTKFNSSFPFL